MRIFLSTEKTCLHAARRTLVPVTVVLHSGYKQRLSQSTTEDQSTRWSNCQKNMAAVDYPNGAKPTCFGLACKKCKGTKVYLSKQFFKDHMETVENIPSHSQCKLEAISERYELPKTFLSCPTCGLFYKENMKTVIQVHRKKYNIN